MLWSNEIWKRRVEAAHFSLQWTVQLFNILAHIMDLLEEMHHFPQIIEL